ncbi:hypothetical protein DSL72_002092 [Monilinia vaccinii-corymbosi]|uniref:NADAR domain-containing protein n=1 Tax=Monilinia vaccinii-corymbosi TaxID=61207 RepID=A0A8A3PBL8_9HELO|nr:hypothetical protein DSL72_002092 [Monilinia vaccinii-corymbosi]
MGSHTLAGRREYNDKAAFLKIAHAKDGNTAKKLGSEIKGLDVTQWNKVSQKYLAKVIYFKFRNNEEIKEELISTGDRLLIQATDDVKKTPVSEWPGENKLEEKLIRLRFYFQKSAPSAADVNDELVKVEIVESDKNEVGNDDHPSTPTKSSPQALESASKCKRMVERDIESLAKRAKSD